MYTRLLSSSSSGAGIRALRIRTLKKYLHQLYLRVHPDRFGQHPKERAVNEASFQRLQQYLDESFGNAGNNGSGRDSRRPQMGRGMVGKEKNEKLTFFAHNMEHKFGVRSMNGGEEKVSSTGNEIPVTENLTNEDDKDEKLLKASVDVTRQNLTSALVTLFQYLGLEPPPPELLSDDKHSTGGYHSHARGTAGYSDVITFHNLRDMARRTRTAAMESRFSSQKNANNEGSKEDGSSIITNKSQLIVLALQRSRGIHIRLGKGLPSGDRQHFLLQRLAFAIEMAKDVDMHAGCIELDGSFEVGMTRDLLRIGGCASDKAWLEALRNRAFSSACERKRRRRKETAKMEDAAARHLNLRFVIFDAGHQTEADSSDENISYIDLYHDLVEDLSNTYVPPSLKRHLSNMTLVLSPPGQGYEENDEISAKTHHQAGVVQVPLLPSTNPQRILEALENEAPSLSHRHSKHRREMEHERNVEAAVIRSLRLDRFRRGVSIDNEQWRCACMGILKHSLYLRKVLEGTKLVVTDRVEILGEKAGDELGIPWDVEKVVRSLKESNDGD